MSEKINPEMLRPQLRELYERHLKYTEELVVEIRELSGGTATEDFLNGVRERHIAHAQESVLVLLRDDEEYEIKNATA